jgi:hypothetical protein
MTELGKHVQNKSLQNCSKAEQGPVLIFLKGDLAVIV